MAATTSRTRATAWARAVLAAMGTSGVLHGASDVVAQTVEAAFARRRRVPAEGAREDARPRGIDAGRTGKFAAVGFLLHGPFFFHVFRAMDRIVGTQRTVRTVVLKSLLGQFVTFPVYLCAFFTVRGAFDGDAPAKIQGTIATKLVPTVSAGAFVWVPANLVNFALVPLQYRVLFVNTIGLGWQAYMSTIVAAKADPAHTGEPTTVPA